VETYAADPQATKAFANGETFEITITKTGGTVSTDVASGAVAQAIQDAGLTIGDIKCSSNTKWSTYTVKGKVESHGGITWSYTPTDLENAMKGNT
ncbi:MAG: hypothetical protein K2N39_06155, partial [Lachnospiraceae bacterium]|nr:hypothetical protein [Lachnospiraceae bacterium]